MHKNSHSPGQWIRLSSLLLGFSLIGMNPACDDDTDEDDNWNAGTAGTAGKKTTGGGGSGGSGGKITDAGSGGDGEVVAGGVGGSPSEEENGGAAGSSAGAPSEGGFGGVGGAGGAAGGAGGVIDDTLDGGAAGASSPSGICADAIAHLISCDQNAGADETAQNCDPARSSSQCVVPCLLAKSCDELENWPAPVQECNASCAP